MAGQHLIFRPADHGFVLEEDAGGTGQIGRLWAFTTINEVAAFLVERYRPADAESPEIAVARELEWSASVPMETGGEEAGCPVCGAAKTIGHNRECRIAAVLGKPTGEPE